MLAPEVKIDIGGRERIMRPRIKAIMNIEAELGANIISIINRFMVTDIGARDVVAILYHGLDGSTDRLERSDIETALEQNGLMNYLPNISKFLEVHLQGQPMGKPQQKARQ